MTQVPEVGNNEIPGHPNKAGITSFTPAVPALSRGRQRSREAGDYRGTGCSSCQVPYSNEGKTDVDCTTTANDRGENGLSADYPLGTTDLASGGNLGSILLGPWPAL